MDGLPTTEPIESHAKIYDSDYFSGVPAIICFTEKIFMDQRPDCSKNIPYDASEGTDRLFSMTNASLDLRRAR